ncbi:hypothetical protein [Microvirga pudoricolor]|uniref:hypothetical protein n=1 Tax=Microvirga pudoricolor TaxID=2778729 RepID=UPI001951533D|nr:hypothetical protein [Microvirga pudoricolor]MBM6595713.1 hypothetical protein [Microvirga pudoricolor]
MSAQNVEIDELRAELRGLEALVSGLVLSLIQRRIFTTNMIVREIKHTEAQLQMLSAPEGTIAVIQRMRMALEDDMGGEAP